MAAADHRKALIRSHAEGDEERFYAIACRLRPRRDRSELGVRCSLVVTLETDEENVDIWTPVATEIGVPVEIAEI